MLCRFDAYGSFQDSIDDEVGDLAHKSVQVSDRALDNLKDPVQIKGVQVRADRLDQVLQIAHRGFQTFPALAVVHGLT